MHPILIWKQSMKHSMCLGYAHIFYVLLKENQWYASATADCFLSSSFLVEYSAGGWLKGVSLWHHLECNFGTIYIYICFCSAQYFNIWSLACKFDMFDIKEYLHYFFLFFFFYICFLKSQLLFSIFSFAF